VWRDGPALEEEDDDELVPGLDGEDDGDEEVRAAHPALPPTPPAPPPASLSPYPPTDTVRLFVANPQTGHSATLALHGERMPLARDGSPLLIGDAIILHGPARVNMRYSASRVAAKDHCSEINCGRTALATAPIVVAETQSRGAVHVLEARGGTFAYNQRTLSLSLGWGRSPPVSYLFKVRRRAADPPPRHASRPYAAPPHAAAVPAEGRAVHDAPDVTVEQGADDDGAALAPTVVRLK